MLVTHYLVGTRSVIVLALVGLAGALRAEDKLPTIKNSVGMQLLLIPAGEFLMGSSPADNGARVVFTFQKKCSVPVKKGVRGIDVAAPIRFRPQEAGRVFGL
ncbi:MAG TPA: hypothetical protein VGM05_06275 [Planctomycetaceae bacterium]|jgi:formylglycine-generating enzyme required for sulfatase activity